MRYSIAQINPCLGDFDANLNKIIKQIDDCQAGIIILPELAISGYNPQDLAMSLDFIKTAQFALDKIIAYSENTETAIVIGNLYKNAKNDKAHNSAFFIHRGKILHRHDKIYLPNYGIFDEKRLFVAGTDISHFKFKNQNITLLICEDLWHLPEIKQSDLIISINASPYEVGKAERRLNLLKQAAQKYDADIIYCNQVGLQDSVIYDGHSLVLNKKGRIIAQLSSFTEDTINFDFIEEEQIFRQEEEYAQIYKALVFALQQYLDKNRLSQVVLGLSGGIDSTLTAIIAIDAIGKDNVKLITMPSRYTSKETFNDADQLLKLLETKADNISIEDIFNSTIKNISPLAKHSNKLADLTEQNMQARIRGLILMSIANEHGYLLLTTGNKSELATGYATLYGDMNGGYNLLKDLYKRDIYGLANYRNQLGMVIPQNIIKKAPSAELKADQKDSDNLPDYPILDEILFCYIEKQMSKNDIIAHMQNHLPSNKNHEITELVDKILNLVRIAEFKRNQSTLGPKIRNMSFDLDWRRPIINRF